MAYNDRGGGGGGGGGESYTVTLASSCDFRQVSNALGDQLCRELGQGSYNNTSSSSCAFAYRISGDAQASSLTLMGNFMLANHFKQDYLIVPLYDVGRFDGIIVVDLQATIEEVGKGGGGGAGVKSGGGGKSSSNSHCGGGGGFTSGASRVLEHIPKTIDVCNIQATLLSNVSDIFRPSSMLSFTTPKPLFSSVPSDDLVLVYPHPSTLVASGIAFLINHILIFRSLGSYEPVSAAESFYGGIKSSSLSSSSSRTSSTSSSSSLNSSVERPKCEVFVMTNVSVSSDSGSAVGGSSSSSSSGGCSGGFKSCSSSILINAKLISIKIFELDRASIADVTTSSAITSAHCLDHEQSAPPVECILKQCGEKVILLDNLFYVSAKEPLAAQKVKLQCNIDKLNEANGFKVLQPASIESMKAYYYFLYGLEIRPVQCLPPSSLVLQPPPYDSKSKGKLQDKSKASGSSSSSSSSCSYKQSHLSVEPSDEYEFIKAFDIGYRRDVVLPCPLLTVVRSISESMSMNSGTASAMMTSTSYFNNGGYNNEVRLDKDRGNEKPVSDDRNVDADDSFIDAGPGAGEESCHFSSAHSYNTKPNVPSSRNNSELLNKICADLLLSNSTSSSSTALSGMLQILSVEQHHITANTAELKSRLQKASSLTLDKSSKISNIGSSARCRSLSNSMNPPKSNPVLSSSSSDYDPFSNYNFNGNKGCDLLTTPAPAPAANITTTDIKQQKQQQKLVTPLVAKNDDLTTSVEATEKSSSSSKTDLKTATLIDNSKKGSKRKTETNVGMAAVVIITTASTTTTVPVPVLLPVAASIATGVAVGDIDGDISASSNSRKKSKSQQQASKSIAKKAVKKVEAEVEVVAENSFFSLFEE